jgi:hypothetical protein
MSHLDWGTPKSGSGSTQEHQQTYGFGSFLKTSRSAMPTPDALRSELLLQVIEMNVLPEP